MIYEIIFIKSNTWFWSFFDAVLGIIMTSLVVIIIMKMIMKEKMDGKR